MAPHGRNRIGKTRIGKAAAATAPAAGPAPRPQPQRQGLRLRRGRSRTASPRHRSRSAKAPHHGRSRSGKAPAEAEDRSCSAAPRHRSRTTKAPHQGRSRSGKALAEAPAEAAAAAAAAAELRPRLGDCHLVRHDEAEQVPHHLLLVAEPAEPPPLRAYLDTAPCLLARLGPARLLLSEPIRTPLIGAVDAHPTSGQTPKTTPNLTGQGWFGKGVVFCTNPVLRWVWG